MVAERKAGRFLVESGLTGLFAALGLWVFIPELMEGSLHWIELGVFVAGIVGFAFALVNIISLPKVNDDEFIVGYGPIHRRIEPSKVERIYKALNGRYVVRESGRFFAYHFSASAYENGEELEAAIRRWAAVNRVRFGA